MKKLLKIADTSDLSVWKEYRFSAYLSFTKMYPAVPLPLHFVGNQSSTTVHKPQYNIAFQITFLTCVSFVIE